jgi:hypothetical protein
VSATPNTLHHPRHRQPERREGLVAGTASTVVTTGRAVTGMATGRFSLCIK